MWKLRRFAEKFTNFMMDYSVVGIKVREATNGEPWGPTTKEMKEIAWYTFESQFLDEILDVLWERIINYKGEKAGESEWRKGCKALVVMEYLIKNGSNKVAEECRKEILILRNLTNKHCSECYGFSYLRDRCRLIIELLSDKNKLERERTKAEYIRKNTEAYHKAPVGTSNNGPSQAYMSEIFNVGLNLSVGLDGAKVLKSSNSSHTGLNSIIGKSLVDPWVRACNGFMNDSAKDRPSWTKIKFRKDLQFPDRAGDKFKADGDTYVFRNIFQDNSKRSGDNKGNNKPTTQGKKVPPPISGGSRNNKAMAKLPINRARFMGRNGRPPVNIISGLDLTTTRCHSNFSGESWDSTSSSPTSSKQASLYYKDNRANDSNEDSSSVSLELVTKSKTSKESTVADKAVADHILEALPIPVFGSYSKVSMIKPEEITDSYELLFQKCKHLGKPSVIKKTLKSNNSNECNAKSVNESESADIWDSLCLYGLSGNVTESPLIRFEEDLINEATSSKAYPSKSPVKFQKGKGRDGGDVVVSGIQGLFSDEVEYVKRGLSLK